jgi:hypothetical protein
MNRGGAVRIEGQHVEVSPEQYVRMVVEAVEARVRLLLADVPAGAQLRAPEGVADTAVRFVQAEQVRLSG